MKARAMLVVLAVLVLAGCAGGAVLEKPRYTEQDLREARRVLAERPLAPSRDTPDDEMLSVVDRVWQRRTAQSVVNVCSRVFEAGSCRQSVANMKLLVLTDRDDVNAWARADTHTIGLNAGLLRVAGSDAEIAAVMAHEAAHLIFRHAEKKTSNAAGHAYGTAAVLGGLMLALCPTCTQSATDLAQAGAEAGYQHGFYRYSPEMEIEADQFAAWVLADAGYPVEASTDLVLRLRRGFVSPQVAGVDGYAGYLRSHPAYDERLAAAQAVIDTVRARGPDGRPMR